MTSDSRPAPADIRRARRDNPKMRERDLALQLGVSEAELVAAHVGEGVRRIAADANGLLKGLGAVGEVMALTRNESAVHEKIGVYDNVVPGERAAMVLGADIDLRIFPGAWAHGFAVKKTDADGGVRRSLQFFGADGDAVHKVHLRPLSDVAAYEALVDAMALPDQSRHVEITSRGGPVQAGNADIGATDVDALRQGWSTMTDVHQFHGLLRRHGLKRHQAISLVGEDYAWRLDPGCVSALFAHVANEDIPIMCFVANEGCIQIHSGPVRTIKPMGPWINVMDPTFHLHLRADHVQHVWAVRKPTKDGHVTSIEFYGVDREMIIQFFGQRKEGRAEREDWRMLAENLPRALASTAA